jgi:hypothetical protein
MLTGLLHYAERVQPGWIDEGFSLGLLMPSGLIGTGERWCQTFLSVAHGEATLRGVDRSPWRTWRDGAGLRAQAFRAEFDPYNILPTYAAAAGLELDELCRHMGRDDGPDPLAEAASR